MATKSENEKNKEIALLYYMQGMSQKDIAEKLGISPQTINIWAKQNNWNIKRAGASVTRQELVNKSLAALNQILDQVYRSEDPELLAALPDKLAKFASAIEKLDKKSNIVSTMEAFMHFTAWLNERRNIDGNLTASLIRDITKYQDTYVSECIKL
jgi:transcriptional regulator with XRE-family HTH domain